jgi:hypothetical protein
MESYRKGERYIVPDDDDVGQETALPESEVILRHTRSIPTYAPGHTPEVSDTVNEPVELSEEPWFDLQGIDVEESTMQPYQDDRVRPDSDDVDNQEPVQLGGRRLVRSRDTMRSTRPRVVIKNHRSEPYTNNILVNVSGSDCAVCHIVATLTLTISRKFSFTAC